MPISSSFSLAGTCFQFPLHVNRIPSVIKRRRKADYDTEATDDDVESTKSSRDPETHFTYTSSGNSDLDSPSFVPVMSVLPPTPVPTPPLMSPTTGECPPSISTLEEPFARKPRSAKPSSLTDVSKASSNAASELDSLLKPVGSVSPASKPLGNMLLCYPWDNGPLNCSCFRVISMEF